MRPIKSSCGNGWGFRFLGTPAVFCLLFLSLVGVPGLGVTHASATSISIVADTTVTVDESNQLVILKFSLTNEGDELAREVGVEFPSQNESVIAGKELYPKQKVEHEQKIKFETLGIKTPGTYAIPYRVLYKDANYYPFSAPYVASATIGSAPTRGVNLELKGREFFEPIAFVDGTEISGIIESITTTPLSDIKLEALASTEFLVQLSQPSQSTVAPKLEVGNTSPFDLKISNRSALPGSEYALILLVTGTAEGKHLAEPFYLRLQVISAWKFYRNFLIAAVIAVVVLGFAGLTLKKKKPS